MKKGFGDVGKKIESYEKDMVKTMGRMIEIKSIAPTSGGAGESERADFLEDMFESWGFTVTRFDYKDDNHVTRSSLVTKLGDEERTIWLVAHIDTVSEGDISLWKTDPFKMTVSNGRMYGRGVSDNGQEAVAGMYALKALKETKAKLMCNLGLALVADEELGSRYGIQKLLQEGIFLKDDMFVVPDWGNAEGDKIEIAEKGVLWLKITVIGKQVHASTPEKGINAYRHSMKLLSQVDDMLHKKYNASNGIFEPSVSTFEVTKHEKNVDSVNIIPGIEVSYLDCRVLPQYSLESVIKDIRSIASGKEFKDVEIRIEEFNREDATPQTLEGAEVVQLLKSALKDLRKIDAKVVGIGGGTCAAFFRKKGKSAAVWSTEAPVAHEPNEYALIENMVNDSKVLAYLPLE